LGRTQSDTHENEWSSAPRQSLRCQRSLNRTVCLPRRVASRVRFPQRETGIGSAPIGVVKLLG
jgi:hypothetical protein